MAIADIARRVAALDARLSTLTAFQQAVPSTTESPVPGRLAAVSQQLEQLTLLATLHFASEADKRLGTAGVPLSLPTPPAPPPPAPPPPPPPPPPSPLPNSQLDTLKNDLKNEIQEAKK